MEAGASVAVAARGVSLTALTSQSQSSRKERRMVSEHPVQSSGNEDLGRSKLGQGDERLIYEVREGRQPVEVEFFPITVANGCDHEPCLDDVVKQREQLQHLEVNLKAHLMSRSEAMEMQERFDSQINEHITAIVKLQEQIHEREKTLKGLQKTLEDRDKELHAIRLDTEAAWAKEDLLQEQNIELATFRRERDNVEAERVQHVKKIHDLQEHIQEKDRQFIEMQEQHRVAQETIIYKDEQIREAQAWITRVQEKDALQSTATHSLQTELRERTEQYNQLWLACQRQFTEMERLHLHTLQQLQLELSEARAKSGTYSDGTRTNQSDLKDLTHFGHTNGVQPEGNGRSITADISSGPQNGNVEIISSFSSTSTSPQTNHIHAVQIGQSLHGMQTYLSPGHLTALHPSIMHQQGVPQNLNMHPFQFYVDQFNYVSANSSLPHPQNQQALSGGSQMQNHESDHLENDQNLSRPETQGHKVSTTRQAVGYVDVHFSQELEPYSVVPLPNEGQQSLQQISSQFHGLLRLNHSEPDLTLQLKNAKTSHDHVGETQSSTMEKLNSAVNASEAVRSVKFGETNQDKVSGSSAQEAFIGVGHKTSALVGKTVEMALLDEESLLASVVRTIPPGPGGRIQISEKLLNRLTKVLAPLHWSDYKKKYGELDDFLGSHPELFLIEGDYIQVHEGAQEIIAGMAARAKVRAAATSSSYSSVSSSVSVTPMAQSRPKKAPTRSVDSRFLKIQNQHPNGVSMNTVGSLSTVRILSKRNNQTELNGSEIRPCQTSLDLANGNGKNLDSSDLGSSLSKVINHGRPAPNFSGRHQGRSNGALPNSRR